MAAESQEEGILRYLMDMVSSPRMPAQSIAHNVADIQTGLRVP